MFERNNKQKKYFKNSGILSAAGAIVRDVVGFCFGAYSYTHNWVTKTTGTSTYYPPGMGGNPITYKVTTETSYNPILHPIDLAIAAIFGIDLIYKGVKSYIINKSMQEYANDTRETLDDVITNVDPQKEGFAKTFKEYTTNTKKEIDTLGETVTMINNTMDPTKDGFAKSMYSKIEDGVENVKTYFKGALRKLLIEYDPDNAEEIVEKNLGVKNDEESKW